MPEALGAPTRGLTAGWQPLVLAGSLGLLHAATFAPWGYWWAQLVVLTAFAALVLAQIRDRRKPLVVALTGLVFGFGWFTAGVGWLYVSMHTYGMMPAPLALLALLLFAGYLGLFPAAAAAATTWLSSRGPRYLPAFALPAAAFSASALPAFAFLFAAAFTLAELARGHFFTGFPWLAIGYAQVDGPLAGYAALIGSYGVGFATCLVAALLAGLLAVPPARLRDGTRPKALLAGHFVALAAVLLGGIAGREVAWTTPAGALLEVRLLQGNVPQQLKFEPAVARQTMQRYLELMEAEPADLIVLPETAWTVPWQSTPPELAQRLEQFVRTSGSAVAIGLPLTTPVPGAGGSGSAASRKDIALTNSVMLFDRAVVVDGARPARYDKRHLVPFGEFVPWGFRWFVDLMTIPLGDFGRGSQDQPPLAVKDQRISFNICYEDVFGEELLPALQGDAGATILANVSNIAWFGDSHAPPQHLQIARMRTLETGRPMIRATNTGVTAAIDHDGTLQAALPTYQLGALAVTVQGRSGLTPYARTGNWTVLALAALILLAAALRSPALLAGGGKPAKIPR